MLLLIVSGDLFAVRCQFSLPVVCLLLLLAVTGALLMLLMLLLFALVARRGSIIVGGAVVTDVPTAGWVGQDFSSMSCIC